MFQVPLTAWLPYVLPYFVFVLLTSLEPYVPNYPLAYSLKTLLVTVTIAACWKHYPLRQKLSARWISISVVAGLILLPVWVGADNFLQPAYRSLGHFLHIGSDTGGRMAFNPNGIHKEWERMSFIAVRLFGLAIVVPIAEEVLYRGLIMRAAEDLDDFRRVAIGTIGMTGIVVTSLLFAISHPEWGSALLFNAAMLGLTGKSKNLRSPIIAHAVTNLALGIYVLTAHQYRFW